MGHKNERACAIQLPACLSHNPLVGLVFTTCLYVFLACPAEMLLTQQLKTGKCPSQVGYVYNRLVRYPVWLVSVVWCYLEVESWYLTRTGWQVL